MNRIMLQTKLLTELIGNCKTLYHLCNNENLILLNTSFIVINNKGIFLTDNKVTSYSLIEIVNLIYNGKIK
jgi:hypothetical protein